MRKSSHKNFLQLGSMVLPVLRKTDSNFKVVTLESGVARMHKDWR